MSNYTKALDPLMSKFLQVREFSQQLIEPLSDEDCNLQAMPETSPAKWHLAHTTWFFETFILLQISERYRTFNPHFKVLFNSYYNAVGNQFKRASRHILSRPVMSEVMDYRAHVTQAICEQETVLEEPWRSLLELGIQHEQQHQELLLMDIKYCFYQNPMYPAVIPKKLITQPSLPLELSYHSYLGNVYTVGADEADGFSYDNEGPQHQVLVQPFKLATRLITNREYLNFIKSGGYDNPVYWLSDGWVWLNQELQNKGTQKSPLYWIKEEGGWYEFTLHGKQPLDLNSPVCHINHYEANAFACWSGARLPTEFEWEIAANQQTTYEGIKGHFADQLYFHPSTIDDQRPLSQLFGNCWEWTASSYQAYPGYEPSEGAVGEYNGKFMCNQMVLKGGACITPLDHVRASYRNFFYPHERWPVTGLRLARDN